MTTEDFEERIVDIDVAQEMRGSFLEYAYSVIYQRALPDARDGLKPVQRRILYQMSEMGLRPDRGHVKCARVVGEVMGRLHPHGDLAIYDALVRMAQAFTMRVPLIDGHGNFGSMGGDDPPAAMRYTEARLAPPAMPLVASLDEEVVDFVPNYDGQERQPDVLPAAFPNLLVNGSAGIAVGMATNMPPHNLGEVVAAARHLVQHPDASLERLMRFVPGPDLPTGGKIVGLEGVRDAYATGRGSFRTRAVIKIENITARRKGIVVTELPWTVGPERVISRIKELVQAKRLSGISDVKDLTDREKGLRLVIEVKGGFNPEAVLSELYRLTPLEESFGINNVALVDGQPRTFGLRELLEVYVDHRLSVVRRRCEYRRGKREHRLHLVAGLLIALLNIDEVIRIIRGSDDAAQARVRLMSTFELSEVQAQYILDTPLRRLTKYDRLELERESEELRRDIDELTAILESDELLRKMVSDELAEVAKEHGTTRRTVLVEGGGTEVTAAVPLEIVDEPCRVLLSSTGLLARTTSFESLPRDTPRASHDVILSEVRATTRGDVAVLSSAGRLVRVSAMELPSLPEGVSGLAGGGPISEFLQLDRGEAAVALASLDATGAGLVLATAQGMVKRVVPDYPQNRDSFDVVSLKDGDRVIGGVQLETGEEELVFITTDAQLLRFPASSVRPQGRAAGGMAGIRLGSHAEALWFGALSERVTGEPRSSSDPRGAVVVTVAGTSGTLLGTQGTTIKVAPFADFPRKGRATGGVRCHRFLKGEDRLVLAWAGPAPTWGSTAAGVPIDLPEPTGRRDGSGSPISEPLAVVGGMSEPGQETSRASATPAKG